MKKEKKLNPVLVGLFVCPVFYFPDSSETNQRSNQNAIARKMLEQVREIRRKKSNLNEI